MRLVVETQNARTIVEFNTEPNKYQGILEVLTAFCEGLTRCPWWMKETFGKRLRPPPRSRPKVREITSWILRRPDSMDADEWLKLKNVLVSCPHLNALAGHVQAFAEMMTGRHGDRLDAWMARVDADDLPYLRSFTIGIRRDYTAVLAGLTLPHSSGAPVTFHGWSLCRGVVGRAIQPSVRAESACA